MNKETVVLLHGITREFFDDMRKLERRFEKEGYNCINIKYDSTKYSIDKNSKIIHDRLENDHENSENETGINRYTNADKVHFVGHSMGGLVTRHIMAHNRPDNLGSVVMMGTPNKGSHMADLAAKSKFLTRAFNLIFGPAAPQLRTDYEHFKNEVIDYPLGIIAGSKSLVPFANMVFEGPSDMLVSVENTEHPQMTDHIVIPVDHFMTRNERVINEAVGFIKSGRFDHGYNRNLLRTPNYEKNFPDEPAFQ